jgi:hypothetical protein
MFSTPTWACYVRGKAISITSSLSVKIIFLSKHTPSSPTLRQRLDLATAASYDWQTILLEESADLLRSLEVPLTPVTVKSGNAEALSWLPLDLVPFEPFTV